MMKISKSERLRKARGPIRKHVDRRVLRTKRAIQLALAQMMSEMETHSITILDLARRAHINRKTFYNYYPGIPDVMDELQRDILSQYEEFISGIDFHQSQESLAPAIARLLTILDENADLCGPLFASDKHLSFIFRLSPLFKETTRKVLVSQGFTQTDSMNITLDYAITGLISVLQSWFQSGRKMHPRELSISLSRLLSINLSEMIDS